MEMLRHRRTDRSLRPEDCTVFQPQFGDRHPVLGQRAGLVRAQHRRRAERLDGRSASGQHPRPRDAPGAHRHEHGEHDRETLPAASTCRARCPPAPRRASRRARVPYSSTASTLTTAADHGEHPHEPPRLRLQPWRLGLQCAERLTDLADFAACAGRDHLGDARAAHDQRAGKHDRQIVAARPRGLLAARRRRRLSCGRARTRRSAAIHRSAGRGLAASTASAGTRSPSASTTRSPRTTSRPAIRLRSPSRMTSARGLVRSRSASRTRSVRVS